MPSSALLTRLRDFLPQGGRLPASSWQERHRWIVRLLWAHVVLIPAYGLLRDYSPQHMVLETLVPLGAAVASQTGLLERRVRTVVASFGLLSCSGILVHLSGGQIEAHFHFFVMVAVVSLYQDWLPFLTAIAYVFVQHGLFGALSPHSVYNHPDAVEHPWRWAAIHAGFIAAESVACLANWRLNETLYASEHGARVAAESARADLALLVDASEALTSSFDVDAMLGRLLALVTPAMAEGCVVHLLHEESGTISRRVVGGDPPEDADDLVTSCLRSGEVICAPEPETGTVVVPLVGRTGVLGALTLTGLAAGERREQLVQVALELGRRAGIAVENAQLYTRERSVAVTLQHALLPEALPEAGGIQSAARYVAGGPGVDVGGDWYDLIPLTRSRLLLVMGDVVGRGEKAAALMGQLRSALRGHTLVTQEPAALLTHLNRMLDESAGSDMATLLCGLLDPVAGTFTVASAGHPPAALRAPDRAVHWLAEASGPPLGAVSRPLYAESTSEVPPGSTLLLYTDGLVEDRRVSLDVGLERLGLALAEGPHEAGPLCDHVLERMLFDRKASDDTALMAVQLLPVDEELFFDLPLEVSSLEPLRASFGRWLHARGATREESYEILVATCEAVANAIVHARGPSSSRVQVDVSMADGVRVEVRDRGSWRPPGTGTGGRGLGIMQSFMDDVDVDRGDSGTTVRMRRRLAAHEAVVGA